MTLSAIILFIEDSKLSFSSFYDIIWKENKDSKITDMLAISLPAFLYIIQNNLQYLAIANLSPAGISARKHSIFISSSFIKYLI